MKKYRIAVWALLAALALAGVACLFALALGTVQDLRRQGRREQRSTLSQREEAVRALERDHEEWRRLPADLDEFRRAHIIGMNDFERFRREMNLCLDDNALRAPNISMVYAPRQGRLQTVRLEFSLEGGYRAVKKFIYDM